MLVPETSGAVLELRRVGRHAAARDAGRVYLDRARQRGDERAAAIDLGRFALAFTEQRRYGEAEQLYRQALEAARRLGDPGLEGTFLRDLGLLYRRRGQLDEAVATLRRTLACFQASGDDGGEMRTFDLLGGVERERGHQAAARASYERALDLSCKRQDERQQATIAQNLGVLDQVEALALDEGSPERARLLESAVERIETCLALLRGLGDDVGAAGARFQLAVLHRLRADLDATSPARAWQAEQEARRSS